MAGELRAGFDRRYAKSVTLTWVDGTEIDVHRTLAAGPFGFAIDLPQLHSRTVEFKLADRTFHGLDPVAQTVHAAYHLALGADEVRASNLRDLALLVNDPAIDAREVVGLATAWRGAAVVARAVNTMARFVPQRPSPLSRGGRLRADATGSAQPRGVQEQRPGSIPAHCAGVLAGAALAPASGFWRSVAAAEPGQSGRPIVTPEPASTPDDASHHREGPSCGALGARNSQAADSRRCECQPGATTAVGDDPRVCVERCRTHIGVGRTGDRRPICELEDEARVCPVERRGSRAVAVPIGDEELVPGLAKYIG